jgi:hypothetical protein
LRAARRCKKDLKITGDSCKILFRLEIKNRTEQNRTEQNRTEQNRTEQNRTEQNRTELKDLA